MSNRRRPMTRRERLEAAIAAAIDALDLMDADPDLEDSHDLELDMADLEEDTYSPGPTLCRSTARELREGVL